MKRLVHIALQFRIVTLTLLVGLGGGILWALGYGLAIQVIFSGFALANGAVLAVHMTATGEIVEISANTVLADDTILVRSGEVVPVDGTLLSAGGSFDESSLTGGSLPVQRLKADAVLSGSINGLNAVTPQGWA